MNLNPQPDFDLQPHNSLGVPSRCSWYFKVTDKHQLPDLVAFARDSALPLIALGAGTNVVFGEQIPAVVAEVGFLGKEIVGTRDDTVIVEVSAGENWHDFVAWTLEKKLYGLENLALIPGTCGAAPIQNIGAYGVELSDRVESVEIFDITTQGFTRLDATTCEFSYRDSVFKQDLQNRAIVVSLRLTLSLEPNIQLSYPALTEYMTQVGLPKTPKGIFDAVCAIRQSKLPNPEETPNVGSFFKNPIVDASHVEKLREQYPTMPVYAYEEEQVKIAAAWLIDQSGWKGYLNNGVGVHDKQALVIVNPGRCSSSQILELAEKISAEVAMKFGVALEMEPRVIG